MQPYSLNHIVTIVVKFMKLMSMLLKLYLAQADYKNLEIRRNYYVTMWLIKTNKIWNPTK